MVTWYQMAAYCRWLSTEEGFPEDEIGYPPLDQIRSGMQLKPYFLSRSGYRLPTEAEWEYACRAGTTTRWSHGDSVELLPQYAWFKDNSQGRSWPMGMLAPNDLGLFDMEGNVTELCQHHLVSPKTFDDAKSSGHDFLNDAYPTQRPSPHLSLRGGSYAYERRETRSGRRWDDDTRRYDNSDRHVGFRIVRTLISQELQQARQFRRQATESHRTGQSSAEARERSQAQVAYELLMNRHPENLDYAWELADFLLEPADTEWQILEPVEVTSREGATLTRQPDGSVLASGKSPDNDVYTLRFEPRLPAMTALRLEVMPDRSLPRNGSGRDSHVAGGNFHLSEFRIEWAPQSTPDQRMTIPLKRATADFSQNGFPVANSIDDDSKSVWGIAVANCQPHWAIFKPAHSIGDEVGFVLVLKLEFADPVWKQATLGRFRISATNASQPARIDEWRTRLANSSLSGWARLAAAHALLGKPEPARAALTRAGSEPVGEFVDDLFLMALIHRELAQPEQARAWLERGLARFDKNTAEMNFKLLAGDAASVALEQEPPDLSLLIRLEKLLGIQALITSGSPAAELSAKRAETLAKLGIMQPEWYLQRGEWTAASKAVLHTVDKSPTDRLAWLRAAAVLVQAGQADAYRDLCQRMLLQFATSEDLGESEAACKVCLLLAGAVELPARSLEIFDRALTAGTAPDWFSGWGSGTRALAANRAGDSEAALTWSRKSLDASLNLGEPERSRIRAFALAVEALARHELGQAEKARSALDAATALIPAELQKLMSGADDERRLVAADSIDFNWLIAEILRREAEGLINRQQNEKP